MREKESRITKTLNNEWLNQAHLAAATDMRYLRTW